MLPPHSGLRTEAGSSLPLSGQHPTLSASWAHPWGPTVMTDADLDISLHSNSVMPLPSQVTAGTYSAPLHLQAPSVGTVTCTAVGQVLLVSLEHPFHSLHLNRLPFCAHTHAAPGCRWTQGEVIASTHTHTHTHVYTQTQACCVICDMQCHIYTLYGIRRADVSTDAPIIFESFPTL